METPINNIVNNQICNSSDERVRHAERVLDTFVQVAFSSKHVGKDPNCPMCHCMNEMKEYVTKYYSIEERKQAVELLNE